MKNQNKNTQAVWKSGTCECARLDGVILPRKCHERFFERDKSIPCSANAKNFIDVFFFFSVQEFIISVHNLDSGSQITPIIETEERLIFSKKKTELSNSLSPYK